MMIRLPVQLLAHLMRTSEVACSNHYYGIVTLPVNVYRAQAVHARAWQIAKRRASLNWQVKCNRGPREYSKSNCCSGAVPSCMIPRCCRPATSTQCSAAEQYLTAANTVLGSCADPACWQHIFLATYELQQHWNAAGKACKVKPTHCGLLRHPCYQTRASKSLLLLAAAFSRAN